MKVDIVGDHYAGYVFKEPKPLRRLRPFSRMDIALKAAALHSSLFTCEKGGSIYVDVKKGCDYRCDLYGGVFRSGWIAFRAANECAGESECGAGISRRSARL